MPFLTQAFESRGICQVFLNFELKAQENQMYPN